MMKSLINPYLFIKEYYFTAKEVIEFVGDTTFEYFNDTVITDFINAITDAPYNINTQNLPFITNDIFKELLLYFFARYSNHVVCVHKEETLTSYNAREFIIRLILKVSLTWDYYYNLLSLYRANINELMSDVTARTKQRQIYNDTPQLEGVDKYEGDDYATNITIGEGESTSPMNTKIMRLKEIQDHYKRVLEDWVNELECVVIEEDIKESEV